MDSAKKTIPGLLEGKLEDSNFVKVLNIAILLQITLKNVNWYKNTLTYAESFDILMSR